MPFGLPDSFADKAALLQYIGQVIKGPWPDRNLEGGPVYRGGANPSGFSEPSAGDTAQTSMPATPADILKAHDQLMQTMQRPTWQQQYGTPQPGQPSIDTPSMRAAMEAGNARDAELAKLDQQFNIKPGTAQRVHNALVLRAEQAGQPQNPSMDYVKFQIARLLQLRKLPTGGQ